MAFDVKRSFEKALANASGRQPILVAELGLWAALADGRLDGEELAGVGSAVGQLPGLAQFGFFQAEEMARRMRKTYTSEEQVLARIDEIAGQLQDPDLRRLAFKLCAWCAASDGVFTNEEEVVLERVQKIFGLSDGDVETLVHEVVGGGEGA